MQLKDKWIVGLVKPYSTVEEILIQQGFKRCGRMEVPTFQLTIQDSATRSTYLLKIPVSLDPSYQEEHLSKVGYPYLEKLSYMEKLRPSLTIPEPIKRAAESKLAEIADYLQSN